MKDVDKYSAYELEKQGKNIRNYEKSENNGIIVITYDLIDRSTGAAIRVASSSVVGWCSKLGLVLLSAVVPISTPLVAGVIVGTTLGAPAVGAAIGNSTGKAHYFDATTGEFFR
jgi:hypothetical protein